MPSSEKIRQFADVTLVDRPAVGGKGGALGELRRAGIAVPPGFIVCTSAFEQFLSALEEQEPVRLRVEALGDHELDATIALSDRLRMRFQRTPIPEDLRAEIKFGRRMVVGA